MKTLMLPLLAVIGLTGCGRTDQPANIPEMRAHELSLAVSSAGQYAAWHGGFGKGSSIYVQKLDAQGRFIGSPFTVSDGKQLAYEPDLIPVDHELVVAWYEKDRSGKLFTRLAGASEAGKVQWIAMLKAGNGSSRNPVVRQIGDELHVAWIEQPIAKDDSNKSTVWYQRFGLSGKPLAPPQQIGFANRDTWNLNATVSGQDFIVVYDAALSSKAHELQMVVVASDHVDRRQLSADDGFASLYPDLQVNPSGRAALTWFDERDGNQEVYLRTAPMAVFAKGQVPTPIRITSSPGESIGAYVAWNGDRIGLAWVDKIDGHSQIFEQVFAADGHRLRPARQLSSTKNNAGVPAIRAEESGFLMVWNDYAIEGRGAHMNVKSSIARIAIFPAKN